MICVIPDCSLEAKTWPSHKGLCGRHLTRLHRHGDPLYARQSFDLEERLCALIDASGDCWEWTGSMKYNGYGQVQAYGRTQPAHRVVWEWLVGPIPPSLTIDHLCRNRGCVNPDHLEPVTVQVNVKRGIRGFQRARCKRGHDDWKEYKNGLRVCQICRKASRQRVTEEGT